MPSKDLTFDLVADVAGKVRGTHDEAPPLPVTLKRVVVQSTSNCNGRTHGVIAGFSGGATFHFAGAMTDCANLEIALGNLSAPAFITTTLSFELDGFAPGENVKLNGKLVYSIF